MRSLMEFAQDIYDKISEGHSGGSLNRYGQDPRPNGYMVGGHSWTMTVHPHHLDADLIYHYIIQQQYILDDPEMFLGWRTHKGKVYFDISEYFTDQNSALYWAKRQKELAVWDISRQTDILVT